MPFPSTKNYAIIPFYENHYRSGHWWNWYSGGCYPFWQQRAHRAKTHSTVEMAQPLNGGCRIKELWPEDHKFLDLCWFSRTVNPYDGIIYTAPHIAFGKNLRGDRS
jgi:hypothetical protein